MGHRNQLGIDFHPETGDLWASENGPQGGDEVNIIKPGVNYGWPLASYSREYSGVRVTDTPWLAEFEEPEILWWPSIAPSGLAFYTGEHFPEWRGNLFVGSMMVGRMQRTGHVERVVFNRRGEEMRREWLLAELKQRIRDVRQGPDGYLYVLTEEDDAVLLRLEPALAITDAPGSIVSFDRLTETRVAPLPDTEWTTEQRAEVERHAPDGAPGNALRTLIRAPGLADRVMPLQRHITNDSTLSPRHRALLIMRTAWLTQNSYLWAMHASRAADAGVSGDELRRIAEGPAEGWSAFEGALVGMADELFRNDSITDRTWATLSSDYDLPQMMDAVVTVTATTAASLLFNSLGIQPDAGATPPFGFDDVWYRVVVPDREPALTAPRVEPADGDGIRVGRTIRRHEALGNAWYATPGYVNSPERSRLTPHDREILILRTGWNAQAVYEWAKHVGSVGRARDHGLNPLWIAQGGDAPGWNDTELTLIDAANEMYRDSVISDATWARLSEDYDTHQLISIAATVRPLPPGVDDAERARCPAASRRRAVPGARGVLIPDPWFYLAAAVAVLIVGMAKGGFGGGIGIVGVPLMATVVSPAQAAAILLPLLMVMDALAVRAYWGRWKWSHLRLLIPASLVGTVLGFLTFRSFSADGLRVLVALVALVYAAQYFIHPVSADPRPPHTGAGVFWGVTAGFTSFSIHAGGPPLQAYLLPQRMDRTTFQATSVLFFFRAQLVEGRPLRVARPLADPDNHHLAGAAADGAGRDLSRPMAPPSGRRPAILSGSARVARGDRRQAVV